MYDFLYSLGKVLGYTFILLFFVFLWKLVQYIFKG